jgi:hypothetical protein
MLEVITVPKRIAATKAQLESHALKTSKKTTFFP